jgi:hypothetical protein
VEPIARDIMLEVQKRDPSRKERSVPGVTTAAAELKGGG